jgi:hypothetical protein
MLREPGRQAARPRRHHVVAASPNAIDDRGRHANVRFRDDLTATDIVEAIARLHSRIETALAQDVRPRFVAIEPTGLRRSRRAA